MIQMTCDSCDAVHYSASAPVMVERGETCEQCGGSLRLVDEEAAATAGLVAANGRGADT